MPSEKEGLGMALIEAMAMGVTVLGSNVSGINYVLRDFPELLFEAGNVKQLSHAIQHWMNASADERKAQGAALRTYCQQHYSLEQSIRTHEQLYLQLCRR
jgi:glycosyltransferase involved in cell wall biosynthesis